LFFGLISFQERLQKLKNRIAYFVIFCGVFAYYYRRFAVSSLQRPAEIMDKCSTSSSGKKINRLAALISIGVKHKAD